MAEKIDSHFADTGILTTSYVDMEGMVHIKKQQDIQQNLDYATTLRNADDYSAEGIKKGMWHVAHIPDIVIVELLAIGVNVYRDSAKSIVAGLKTLHKEHLLTTNKRIA